MSPHRCPYACGSREFVLLGAVRRIVTFGPFFWGRITQYDAGCRHCGKPVVIRREACFVPPETVAEVPAARPPLRVVSTPPRPPDPEWPEIATDQATLPELP